VTDTPMAAPGLRERKRRATRRAILVAAIEVVRERGFEAATIDEISRIADVSPRTFFNYFSSKEEAIVGDGPTLPDDEVLDAFVTSSGPLLDDLIEIFASSATMAVNDQELILLRRSIMKDNVELSARRFARLHEFESDVISLIERRLQLEAPHDAASDRHQRARLYGLVAIAAMRSGWLAWMDAGDPSDALVEHLRTSFAHLANLPAAAASS
jgi:AcrR family transcriptional regulator